MPWPDISDPDRLPGGYAVGDLEFNTISQRLAGLFSHERLEMLACTPAVTGFRWN